MIKKIIPFLSRISIRILIFNLLLIFIPIGAFLLLDVYETQLLKALEHALVQQGRLLSATLSDSNTSVRAESVRILQELAQKQEARIRVIDTNGTLLVDSSTIFLVDQRDKLVDRTMEYVGAWENDSGDEKGRSAEESILYQIASFPIRIYRRYFKPPVPPLGNSDFYQNNSFLEGKEVAAALKGRYGSATRISSGGQISVTLYSALPVMRNGNVAGIVLVSQSTYRILKDLYEVRLEIFKIFLIALGGAVIMSIITYFTISSPLRKLRNQAIEILDARGRLKGHFKVMNQHDEIGDLSHSLLELTGKLEKHIHFIESFASDVSHEFKNPLASIRSAAELLQDIDEPEDKAKFTSMILSDVSRMEKMLSKVKEITLIDSKLDGEEKSRINCVEIIEQIIGSYRLRDNKNITFIIEENDGIFLEMAPLRFSQVMENLLENAVSFSPAGSIVEISFEQQKGFTLFTITDHGPGIEEQNMNTIFDRFFTYRPGMEDQNHTGLGLSIAKTIVEGYGGSITVENVPGKGARFTVKMHSV